MVETSPCPEVGVLEQFLLGQIPEADAGSLAEHLTHCENCMHSAISLSSADAVASAIQSWSGSSRRSSPAGTTPEESSSSSRPRITLDDDNFLLPPQEPDELGRLGPYRILKVLGEGGMGVVYHAEDPQLGRAIALKVMKPSAAAADAARKRFLREARATAALEHDYIVTIYQVGQDRGIPFLTMQLLQGETLDERLRAKRRLPLAEALRIGRQVAEGLTAAHDRGLMHRDIKPSNIWLEAGRNRVKILDFGLARQAGADDAELTHTGVILGTPAYMAPEQACGDTIDFRCDLFSLGCVIYRMCAGGPPFKGSNSLAILRALAVDTPKPLDEINPEVPPALSELVRRMLGKTPDERPPSARYVAEVLAALEREPAAATKASASLFMVAFDDVGLEPLDVASPPSAKTKPANPPAPPSAKRPGPGASRAGKPPGQKAPQVGRRKDSSSSSQAKSPAPGLSQSAKAPRPSGLTPPDPPAWEDLPVLPSRSEAMRRHRGGRKEWMTIAVPAAVLTLLGIVTFVVLRMVFAK
jgi:serine/threonine protein kinase